MEQTRQQRIGERVRQLRWDKGWSGHKLAAESGLTSVTVYKFEDGRIGNPHVDTVRKLAGALGVDPGELIS